MARQRFVSRRGNSSNVFSDNGSTFVGAQEELGNWLMRLDKCALQGRHLEPNGTSTHPTAVTAEEFGNGLYGR
ncbi:unnamed protein product [Echinostoma caproni]|uniref:Integrase catalytic domain-containing protein n=1 Tax=Echinostoma caproni TaxID=27848 RepID=A0A183AZW7_9TREM|nr:unnamed protein product [Echinostoma caproni]